MKPLSLLTELTIDLPFWFFVTFFIAVALSVRLGFGGKDMSDGSWEEYRRLVMSEFERLHGEHQKLNETVVQSNKDLQAKIDNLSNQVTILNVKASVWGALSAMIVSIGFAVMQFFVKGKQ